MLNVNILQGSAMFPSPPSCTCFRSLCVNENHGSDLSCTAQLQLSVAKLFRTVRTDPPKSHISFSMKVLVGSEIKLCYSLTHFNPQVRFPGARLCLKYKKHDMCLLSPEGRNSNKERKYQFLS